jgi:hypothetical protein
MDFEQQVLRAARAVTARHLSPSSGMRSVDDCIYALQCAIALLCLRTTCSIELALAIPEVRLLLDRVLFGVTLDPAEITIRRQIIDAGILVARNFLERWYPVKSAQEAAAIALALHELEIAQGDFILRFLHESPTLAAWIGILLYSHTYQPDWLVEAGQNELGKCIRLAMQGHVVDATGRFVPAVVHYASMDIAMEAMR